MIRCRSGLLAITVVFFVGCAQSKPLGQNDDKAAAAPDTPGIQVTESGTRYIIHPDKILSGGPPKDGIPPIDDPRFVSASEADTWLSDDEPVMAIMHKGVKRVYPHQILVWHEIVNETIAGDPILITYCPLCGSGLAFERTIDGEAVEFGTSGQLYNSNLLMYDRKTDSYWTQVGGQAIVGEPAGRKLKPVSIDTVPWGLWKRIHPKSVIFGVEVDGVFKAYQEEDLKRLGTIEDQIGSARIRIDRDAAGVVTVRETQSGRRIVKERDFWFVWAAFHPDTLLYED